MPAHTPFKVQTASHDGRSFTLITEGDTVSIGEHGVIRLRRRCADHDAALKDANEYVSDPRLLAMMLSPKVEKKSKKSPADAPADAPAAAPAASPAASPAAKTTARK